MLKTKHLILLGVAAFIIFLIVSAPAAIITSTVERYTPVRFHLVSGSVWHGAAASMRLPGISLGPISWRIRPLSLFRGALAANLDIDSTNSSASDIHGNAFVEASFFGNVGVEDAILSADAEWLFTQAAIPAAASGTFELQIEKLSMNLSDPLPQIKGVLKWKNAAVTYPEIHKLGEYQVVLDYDSSDEHPVEVIKGDIKDINSPLQIQGTALLYTSYRYILDVNVNATDDAPGDLKRVVPLLGTRNDDGAVNIRRQGLLKDL